MIKQLFIFFTILFFSTSVSAQERLMPLPSNNAYPNTESLEKGFRFDYDFVCNPEQRIRLVVKDATQPDCGADDGNGSVTLEIVNAPINAEYTFTYQTPQGDLEIESSNTNVLTFPNLSAGPYIFTVSGNVIADSLELWYSLNNVNTQPIPSIEGNFVKRDVFCDNYGSIGFSFDVTDRKLPVFRWSDNKAKDTLSLVNLRIDSLAPTIYYLQDLVPKSDPNRECHAYQIFEIEREITIDSLAFIDDFSTSLLYPDNAAWVENDVFINQTMAYQPLSFGVATFDGFNEFGQPYEPIDIGEQTGLIDGAADKLTTRPICYNIMNEKGEITPLLAEEDTTLFLEFYYQPQGLGDFPNSRDSLKLEFFGSDNNWHEVWALQNTTKDQHKDKYNYPFQPVSIRIENANMDTTRIFTETHLAIRDSVNLPYDSIKIDRDTIPIFNVNFIFDGFQFRFSNNATVSGFNDHWHIDYIQFDKKVLGSIDDLAPINSIPSILKDYQTMPWTHFKENVEASLKEGIFVPLNNNSEVNPIGGTNSLTIRDFCTEDLLYSSSNTLSVPISTIILEPIDESQVGGTVVKEFLDVDKVITENIPPILDIARDSAVFEITYELIGDENDQNQDNNLLYGYQEFFNYYAYDDGVAEVAYGLEGAESQLAMAYNVLEADVLQGIQINFVNMNSNDEKNSLFLMVWDSIGVGSNKSNLIYSEEIALSPQYVRERNGFHTFLLENPLPVDSGTIYIGFEQDLKNQINLGFDRNNDASGHTFFNSTSIWIPSIIEGSVMMRPVFADELNPEDIVGIEDEIVKKDEVILYPNPSNDRIFFKTSDTQSLKWVHIFDFSGRIVAEEYLQSNGVDVRDLPKGLYLVKTYNEDFQETSMHKLVVSE